MAHAELNIRGSVKCEGFLDQLIFSFSRSRSSLLQKFTL